MIIPRATYRIQFNHTYGFQQAKEIVSYLAALGVSHLYASPIFKAKKKSMHGYDIVDPNQLNPELGSFEDFLALAEEFKKANLFWLQDIVPNHMAYDTENYMLVDVLENGKDSNFFNFFDINWGHPYENMRGRILTPLLGKFYAEALEAGEIQLRYSEEGLSINYYELSLPLRIDSYVHVFEHNIGSLEEKLSSDNPDFIKFLGVIHLFKTLAAHEGDPFQSEQVKHTKKML